MERVEVFLMRKDLEKVLDELQGSRILQSVSMDSAREVQADSEWMEMRSELERIIEFLSPMETPVKGLKSLLSGSGKAYRVHPSEDLKKKTKRWLERKQAEVEPTHLRFRELERDMEYLDEIYQRLTRISGLHLDLSTLSSFDMVRVKVGTTRRFEELLAAVEEAGGSMEGSLIDRKEGIHSVRIAYTPAMESKIGEALRGRLFTEMNLNIGELGDFLVRYGEDPGILNIEISRLMPRLEEISHGLEEMKADLMKKGSRIADEILKPARAYLEIAEMEIEKQRFGGSIFRTDYTNRIIGWVEKDRIDDLRDILDLHCPRRYFIDHRSPTRDEIEGGEVPTSLDNGWLGKMFEPLTNTFSIPRYDEIDPSIWISIPFILFFGLMLGDAGYGLIIMSACGFFIIAGPSSGSVRTTAWMGFLMGLATTLAGIWMGAFFGDLVPRLILGEPGASLYQFDLFGYSMPYDTLKDPMLLFQISLYIGLLQLNIGIALYGIDKLVKKDIVGFFKGSFSWLLIQVGGIIFVGAMLIGWWELDSTLTIIGASTFILGSLLLALESKGMLLFDMEGYLGDLISYTRILALGLSTFGLAMAFNIVGKMLVDTTAAMIPVVLLLLVFLHIFNLLLQALGSAVHSLRLQFVEFFGRFYEGGGTPFAPFGMERIHTRSSRGVGGNEN